MIDRLSNVCAEVDEFAVDSVQQGLEIVSLAGILAVKKLQQLFVGVRTWCLRS